ncbi:TPR repeat-containing protein, partial [Reticulomyxa filosa]
MNFIYLANYADLLRVNAVEYYQKALKLNPTHPVTNSNYAYLLHMYLKQYSKACEHYQQCMEFNSHDFIVATNYVLCLKELKEYDQAISLLKNFPTEDVMAQNLMKEIINAKIKVLEVPQSDTGNNIDSSLTDVPNRNRTDTEPDLPQEHSAFKPKIELMMKPNNYPSPSVQPLMHPSANMISN